MQTLNKRLTLMALAWPIFVETFLRMFLGNVNVFMLSKYSDEAVGAVGVANQLIGMLLMLYGIVAIGTAVIVSQSLGAGEDKRARDTANVALIVSFFFGVILSLGVAIFAKGILRMMNLPEELMEYGVPYLVIVSSASFIQAMIATMSAVARNYGQTKIPMIVAIGMNLINVVANYIVVFRPFGIPAFGVRGIAFSVVISEAIAVIVMFRILFNPINTGLRFRVPKPFPVGILKDILKIGLPGAGGSVSYNISQIACTYIITMLGTDAITTRTYTMNLLMFVMMLGISIGQANQILIGHMAGAGEQDKAYKVCIKSLKLAIACDLGVAVILFLLRRPMLGVFTENPSIISIGSTLLLVSLFLEPGRAFNLVLGGALQGAGDVRFPVIIGILSQWGISVLFSYIVGINFNLGLPGMFLVFAADEWIRGLILLVRWRSGIWKKMSLVKTEKKQEIVQQA